jgi:NADPH:quinone reductase-like Zn-dependent oxidoreductase
MSFLTEQSTYRVTDNIGYKGVKEFKEPLSAELDKNEVLVKIKAVALNYRDLVISDASYPIAVVKNVVAGSDGSGEIVKVGSHVTEFQVGDRVINNFDPTHLYGVRRDASKAFGATTDGVLCQYKVFHTTGVNKLPKESHLSYEEAASLVCTGVTAWNALYGSGIPFVAGQTVLLLGTGGVSVTALVLAKAAGAVTIITSSSDEKLKYVQEKYGADHTINYRNHPDWEKEVLKITNGRGVDFVLEVGGNGTISKSLSSLTPGGQIAIIGFLNTITDVPDIVPQILMKGAHVHGIRVGPKGLAEDLIRFVHAKKLRMPVEKIFGFSQEQVHAAYAHLESQSAVGKIVIKVD